jgi:hypothetical protein
MATGAIVAIVIVVIVVAAVLFMLTAANRRRRLRERFGPEYDRAVTERGNRREAEAELAERERHVRDLDIRPLSPSARNQYQSEWTAVQEQFVDAPQAAVTGAQTLVSAVMEDRGYPTQPYDQTLADLSVEHASTLDHFRAAHDISQNAAAGTATTEDLRQAMIHYRALFAELLGEPTSNLDGRAGQDGAPATEPGAGTAGDRSAPSSIDHSAATPVDEPAATRVDEPAATRVDEPVAARRDEPGVTRVDEPAATRLDEPAATRVDEPAATPADDPAAASVDQPADPALDPAHDAVTTARRQER